MVRSPVSQRAKAPARLLPDVPKLCDPYTPLDPDVDGVLHEDLSPIRGGDRLGRIIRNIRRSASIPTLHLVTGDVGSGKTTELLGLRRRLAKRDSQGEALHVFFVDAETMLDAADVELEDVLVAIWRAVAEDAPAAALTALGEVWKKQVREALEGAVVNLPGTLKEAVGNVSSMLRQAPIELRSKLRTALSSVAPALINGLNKSFDIIRKREEDVAESMEVAIIIDNLEKLNPVDRKKVETLYLERMAALKQLDAHLVITVPLFLVYSQAGASLIGLYGGETVVLPMVKVSQPVAKGGGECGEGVRLLAELLCKRVDFDALFEGGVETAREIARRSGGCIRHALRIVSGAANECDDAPVPLAAVDRSTAYVQSDFERALPEAWIAELKKIAATNQFPADLDDGLKRDMLRHLFVLEYQNGDPGPWFAVHPLVERCRKYQQMG